MVNATTTPSSTNITSYPSALPVDPSGVSNTNGAPNSADSPMAFYVKDGGTTNQVQHTPQKKSKLPLIGGLLLLLLLVVGGAAGLYFMDQQQDTRQQADYPGTANCSACDINSDGIVAANEVTQLSQCIGSQISQSDGSYCFEDGQVRDPNADGVLNSGDIEACTSCLGTVSQANQDSTDPPITECQAITIGNTSTAWINNYSQIELTWKLTGGQVTDYEIWNINYTTLDPANPNAYYLRKLTAQPLPASTTRFVVTNPNELQTRRFLIRGVKTRNQAGEPLCYNQGALCRPPYVENRKVTTTDFKTFNLTWTPTQKPHQKYEIWLINQGTLEELGPEKYYVVKLTDILDVNATSANVTVPEQYRDRDFFRFLIKGINYSMNGQPECSDQWALGVGETAETDNCTLSFTVAAAGSTPTPTLTSTPTPKATATPVLSIGCNQVCASNADCSNSAHICFTDSSGVNRCRLETNPSDQNCQAATGTVVTQSPQVPTALPVAGPEDWLTWLKAGLAVLGVGAALLLML